MYAPSSPSPQHSRPSSSLLGKRTPFPLPCRPSSSSGRSTPTSLGQMDLREGKALLRVPNRTWLQEEIAEALEAAERRLCVLPHGSSQRCFIERICNDARSMSDKQVSLFDLGQALRRLRDGVEKLRSRKPRSASARPSRPPPSIPQRRMTSLYFHHERFGFLKLAARPSHTDGDHEGRREEVCNLCGKSSNFECVDSSGLRDLTCFEVGSSGFDMCTRCATLYVEQETRKVKAWMENTSPTCPSEFYPQGRKLLAYGALSSYPARNIALHSRDSNIVTVCVTPTGHSVIVLGPTQPLRVSPSQLDGAEEECCICMEDLLGKDFALRTPCGHVFHESCIQKLRRTELSTVRRQSNEFRCPLCRSHVRAGALKSVVGAQLVEIVFPKRNLGGTTFVVVTVDTEHPYTASSAILRVDAEG